MDQQRVFRVVDVFPPSQPCPGGLDIVPFPIELCSEIGDKCQLAKENAALVLIVNVFFADTVPTAAIRTEQ
jgi:hypothetical protein